MAGEMLQLAFFVPYLAGGVRPEIREVSLQKFGVRVILKDGTTDRRESAQGQYFVDYSKAVADWKKFYSKKIRETEKFLAAAKAEWKRHNKGQEWK
ncbi:MAG: hypothetical protein WC648_05355 [Candidatus Paceibacterota bacterium]|jgi:hypothetical protein